MIKILFVCHGNICRSPMAEMILKNMVSKQGVADKFYIDSAGTSSEELGNGIYPNTKAVLKKNGIPYTEHYARKITLDDYKKYDYIICMESYNISRLRAVACSDTLGKVYRLMDFTDAPYDIDDPWYHRDFDKTFREITFGCEKLLDKLIDGE